MHLEVGHLGWQACLPDSLPNTVETQGTVALDSREEIYVTALILDGSGIDRKWAPALSDRGYHPLYSATDFQLTKWNVYNKPAADFGGASRY